MSNQEKPTPMRVLVLIAAPRLADKAENMFLANGISQLYHWNGIGTAPNEMINILGLGNPDKGLLLAVLPKPLADETLKKLKRELRLETVDSGIAFTLPLSGSNALLVHMTETLSNPHKGKDENSMNETKHALIAVVLNQGFSEDVMEVARAVGAGGGTVVHSRHIGDKEATGFWGLPIQEEKEILMIVANNDNKKAIMQAIGTQFGMHSEAKAIELSLPIETVIGLDE